MKRKILIIDDERDLCLLMSGFLMRRNYQVACAHSLAEGFSSLIAEHPDVLLLDNNLPDGLGWNEVANIQSLYPGMHITLISATDGGSCKMANGTEGLKRLEKPISLSTLEKYL